jgi:putative transposase
MAKEKNNPHKSLWNADVLNLSMKEVEDLLKLDSAPNAKYSNKTIVYHLLNASTSQTSVSHVSDLCTDAPCEGTIRYRLRNLESEEILLNFNEKLKIHADETVSNNPNIYAIDFTNVPFYGKEKNSGDTIKTKPKQGTSRYYTYATIYLILNNKRYTLAMKNVRKGDTLKDTVDFLINEIQTKEFKIKGVYLDKEFFTVEVINYLQNRKIPYIIPCVKRGRSGGIRELFEGNKSYSTEYTMRSKENEATFQVNVLVKYSKGKYNQNGRKYFAYAVYGMDIPIKKTFNEYRKRFGIESSYRLMNQARIHTSTKNPVLRLLYIGISLLLINIWIYIQWKYLSIPRQGGRQPRKWAFKTILRQINRITEEILGFNTKITLKETNNPMKKLQKIPTKNP